MRIGVTGHMNITADTERLVFDAVCEYLRGYLGSSLVGVSCIARGADSVFAEAVLSLGGVLEIVLPSENYRSVKVNPDHAERFDGLISRAARVQVMAYAEANRDAYVAANEAMLSSVNELIAVWDGREDYSRGGTADVVADARGRGLPVVVIWPDGATRG